jgi:hypothetical protein
VSRRSFLSSACQFVVTSLPFVGLLCHHCWLRNAFQISSSTVLAYRCGPLFTFSHTGSFSSLTLHSFTTKNTTCELHDLTTPRTATLRFAAYDQHWYRLLMESLRSGSKMAAASVRFLLGRAGDRTFNKTMFGMMGNSTDPLTQSAANRTISPAATKAIIDKLVFQDSKSVRTSTIILAAFNVLAALATAISILYDCYWSSKRCAPKYKAT